MQNTILSGLHSLLEKQNSYRDVEFLDNGFCIFQWSYLWRISDSDQLPLGGLKSIGPRAYA